MWFDGQRLKMACVEGSPNIIIDRPSMRSKEISFKPPCQNGATYSGAPSVASSNREQFHRPRHSPPILPVPPPPWFRDHPLFKRSELRAWRESNHTNILYYITVIAIGEISMERIKVNVHLVGRAPCSPNGQLSSTSLHYRGTWKWVEHWSMETLNSLRID